MPLKNSLTNFCKSLRLIFVQKDINIVLMLGSREVVPRSFSFCCKQQNSMIRRRRMYLEVILLFRKKSIFGSTNCKLLSCYDKKVEDTVAYYLIIVVFVSSFAHFCRYIAWAVNFELVVCFLTHQISTASNLQCSHFCNSTSVNAKAFMLKNCHSYKNGNTSSTYMKSP